MYIIVTCLVSLILVLLAGKPFLNILKKNLYGQYIREEGPASHQKKAGTPTGGGILIVLCSFIAASAGLFMLKTVTLYSHIVLMSFLFFSLIGLKDDHDKIKNKQNKGLSAKGKLMLQFAVALIPALYVTFTGQSYIDILGYSLNLGFLYPFFAAFIIVGTSNAVNLTDGLDGLATGTTSIALVAMALIFILSGRYEFAVISVAVMGACLGFLRFNKNPAQIFMGDTGSLGLGGVIGTLAVVGKIELLLVLIGAVFVAETLSVILQVISFKTTGKRIFKMSPLHHHFELCGWSEKKVVYSFWLVGALFAFVACMIKFYII